MSVQKRPFPGWRSTSWCWSRSFHRMFFCKWHVFWTSACFTWTLWTSSIMCWPPPYSHILFNRKRLKKFQGCQKMPSSCVWTGWRPSQKWQACWAFQSWESLTGLRLTTSTTYRHTRTTWPCWSVPVKKEVFSHFPTPPNSTEKQNTHWFLQVLSWGEKRKKKCNLDAEACLNCSSEISLNSFLKLFSLKHLNLLNLDQSFFFFYIHDF